MINAETRAAIVAALAVEFADARYDGVRGKSTGKNSLASVLMARPLVSNPDAAPQVPAPVDVSALLSMVSDAEYQSMDGEFRRSVFEAVRAGNRSDLAIIAASGVKLGFLAAGTAAAISTALSATVDDPNHPAEVVSQSRWDVISAANGWQSITSLPESIISEAVQ